MVDGKWFFSVFLLQDSRFDSMDAARTMCLSESPTVPITPSVLRHRRPAHHHSMQQRRAMLLALCVALAASQCAHASNVLLDRHHGVHVLRTAAPPALRCISFGAAPCDCACPGCCHGFGAARGRQRRRAVRPPAQTLDELHAWHVYAQITSRVGQPPCDISGRSKRAGGDVPHGAA